MIRKITLNENQSIELSGSVGWFMIYKERFGHDILPDIMPLIESGLTLAIRVMQEGGDGQDIIDRIDDEILTDAFLNLSGLELTTILQIIWAMAKQCDKSIGSPDEFYDQFETFPFDLVVPEAINLIINSTISSKNVKSLSVMLEGAKQSHSTKSSSQASTED